MELAPEGPGTQAEIRGIDPLGCRNELAPEGPGTVLAAQLGGAGDAAGNGAGPGGARDSILLMRSCRRSKLPPMRLPPEGPGTALGLVAIAPVANRRAMCREGRWQTREIPV